MLNLNRLQLKKKTKEERALLIDRVTQFIQSTVAPLEIIFIGSILSDSFDEVSDIDTVIIFKDQTDADVARRKLYRAGRPADLPHSLEMICIDRSTYNEKSQIGGIYYTARVEGFLVPCSE